MNQLATTAIILTRTNYGEADRILTLLTPDYGKLRLMAKGVRKIKSKLAGGIELFSVSHIAFIKGRSDIGTLVSSKLERHYGHIVTDIGRVQLGYDLIKLLNKVVEDEVESEYFALLEQTFVALDDISVSEELIRTWFAAQLLRLGGHMPNLQTDNTDQALTADRRYDIDFNSMAFTPKERGHFSADSIKYLRLLFSGTVPRVLRQVSGGPELLAQVIPFVTTMLNTFVRI